MKKILIAIFLLVGITTKAQKFKTLKVTELTQATTTDSLVVADDTGLMKYISLDNLKTGLGNTNTFKLIPSDFDFTNIPIDYDNAVWVISNEHNLGANTITLPENVTLNFQGGKLSNGTLNGNLTKINNTNDDIFGTDVSFVGSWNLEKVIMTWFGANPTNSDNTLEIAQAFRCLVDTKSSQLYIPSGTYITREMGTYSSQTEWLTIGSLIGKNIIGEGQGLSVFKLKANENTRLFNTYFSSGQISNIRFDGNNPTPAWGGDLNNPNTDVLVYIDGYGVDLENVVAQFSGGDGIQLKGFAGVFDIRGADSKSWFNWGWGYVIKDNITVRMNSPWVEQNLKGGINVTNTVGANEQIRRYNNIVINDMYYERVSNYTGTPYTNSIAVQIEGTNGVKVINPMFVLSSDDVHFNIIRNDLNPVGQRGSESNYIELGTQQTLNINIESECNYNKIIKRTVNPDNSVINLTNEGISNSIEWQNIDFASNFSNTSDATIYGYVTNFSETFLILNGERKKGGIFDDVSDYYAPDNQPSYVELQPNGETFGDVTVYNNEVLPINSDLYIVLLAKMSSSGVAQLILQDALTGLYYNFGTKTFGAIDDNSSFLSFRTSEDNLVYSIPMKTDGLGRKIRIRIKYGLTTETADLYHAYITNSNTFPKIAKYNNITIREGDIVKTTTALLPLATEVREGTQVFDTTTKKIIISDGINWLDSLGVIQ